MRTKLVALAVLLSILLSGTAWAEAGEKGCIAAITGVTTVTAACVAALGIASSACPVTVAMGLLEPISGSVCAISIAVASWTCWVSPFTVPSLLWCFFV